MASNAPKLIVKEYNAQSPDEAFEYAFQGIVLLEGNYTSEPTSPDQEAKYGISLQTARLFGHKGKMSHFTVGMAKDIYRKGYWDVNKLNNIYPISAYIAMEMFEVGVNLGVMKPALWLQRLCNSLNTIKGGKYKYGSDLVLDGIISKTTIQRLSDIDSKGHEIIYNGINAMQMSHYITSSYIKPTARQFFVGWSNNRIDSNPFNVKTSIHD